MCTNPWWWSMENMSLPRQSGVVAYMNRAYWGPRCLLPLIMPHLWQVLCCIFNEAESGATAFISHLTFLHTAESSVRDDKLQFGERSSEILTRASSKPLNQLQNDIFINQWDAADSWKTNRFGAVRLAYWFLDQINILCHLGQFLVNLPAVSTPSQSYGRSAGKPSISSYKRWVELVVKHTLLQYKTSGLELPKPSLD